MKIKKAEFICSARSPSMYPGQNLPDVAFVGRSNVGKSSMINTLLNRKGLAKTSSTPGKTRGVNFYRINDIFYVVDLPGYGFARVSRDERWSWKGMVESYFLSKRDIRGVIILVDIRRGVEEEEVMVMDWMDSLGVPIQLVLTKADKLSRSKRVQQVRSVANLFDMGGKGVLCFSSHTGEGRHELWRVIMGWIGSERGQRY